ncbi:MAG: hypothetical protein NZ805_08655 [Armatimonadetes bacterium]|nr:hypothetical protein [Armatimonadota bacterium]MDW8028105.1 hypothetical protein [Armatimonadota bacterium]
MSNVKTSKKSILWFSRGHGFGHVIKDLSIAKKLQEIDPEISILFVSYAHGAQVLEHNPYPFFDLHLPTNNPFFETLVRAGRLIHACRPTVVISHEEFAALPIARLFNIPALFITHWFLEPEHFLMQSLACADQILFIEECGQFSVPPYLVGKVRYVGPVLRSFNYTLKDKPLARQELKIANDTVVISVFPGVCSETIAPAFQLVLEAFDILPFQKKMLIWIGGSDTTRLQKRVSNRADVLVKKSDWQIDRLMVATDLAITKANYTTVLELDALGVPSIALLHGHNPIDEIYAKQRKTVTPLDLYSLSAEALAQTVESILRCPLPPDPSRINALTKGAERAAQFIKEFMRV